MGCCVVVQNVESALFSLRDVVPVATALLHNVWRAKVTGKAIEV